MKLYEVTREGQVFNVLDDLGNAYDEAQDLANRENRKVLIVNATSGEPRYILDEVVPQDWAFGA